MDRHTTTENTEDANDKVEESDRDDRDERVLNNHWNSTKNRDRLNKTIVSERWKRVRDRSRRRRWSTTSLTIAPDRSISLVHSRLSIKGENWQSTVCLHHSVAVNRCRSIFVSHSFDDPLDDIRDSEIGSVFEQLIEKDRQIVSKHRQFFERDLADQPLKNAIDQQRHFCLREHRTTRVKLVRERHKIDSAVYWRKERKEEWVSCSRAFTLRIQD